MWYAPSSWLHRVICLGNIHDTWWMCQSLESPSSPPKNLDLQSPAPPPSPSDMFLATFPWLRRRGAASGIFLRIWPYGRVGGALFVALCFVYFRNFRNSVEYEMACSEISQLSFFINESRKKNLDASPHERMIWKRQRLTYLFNIRYGCFFNQLISWYQTN